MLWYIRTEEIEEIDSLQIRMLLEKLFDPNALWLNFPADILNECCRENNRNECSRKWPLEFKIDPISDLFNIYMADFWKLDNM